MEAALQMSLINDISKPQIDTCQVLQRSSCLRGKKVISKIHQSLLEAGGCVYLPFSPLGHMGLTIFHLPHCALATLCDRSCMYNVLVLQHCQKNQFCPTQVFDLMATKHMWKRLQVQKSKEKAKRKKKAKNQENNLLTLLFSAALPVLLCLGGKH